MNNNNERLNILKKIEKGELTADEAEGLLRKFDAKAQRFLCDSCLYSQDEIEEIQNEKNFLH